jgi:adenine phosphoribosyltransferase
MPSASQRLRERIRTVPDWPHAGIQFRDITPLLQDPDSFRLLVQAMVARFADAGIELVAGIDARGFIIGAVLAHELGVGFVPVRKRGKLPYTTIHQDYALEYGTGAMELHVDAVRPGQRVLLIDDLVATGGTMGAARDLVERLGGIVVAAAAIVDLPELGGSARLRASGLDLITLVDFEGH